MLAVDDDGNLEPLEPDGVALDTLAREPVKIRRVRSEVRLRRSVIVSVDDDAIVSHVGDVDAGIQRVWGQVVETRQRRERMALDSTTARWRRIDQPIDGPAVSRRTPRASLCGPLTRPWPLVFAPAQCDRRSTVVGF